MEPSEGTLERLASEGLITLATASLDETLDRLGLPLEFAPGEQSASERLAELRRDER